MSHPLTLRTTEPEWSGLIQPVTRRLAGIPLTPPVVLTVPTPTSGWSLTTLRYMTGPVANEAGWTIHRAEVWDTGDDGCGGEGVRPEADAAE